MSSFTCVGVALLALIATGNTSARDYVIDSSLSAPAQSSPGLAAGTCHTAVAQGPSPFPCTAPPGWRGNFLRIPARDAAWPRPARISGSMLAGLAPQSHIEQTLQLPAAAGGYTLSWSDGACDVCADNGRAGGRAAPQHYRISFNGAILAERIVSPGDGRQEHHLAFQARGPGLLRFERKGGSGAGTVLIGGTAVRDNMSLPASGSALLVGLSVLMLGGRKWSTEKFAV
jgi:hypothetical protein